MKVGDKVKVVDENDMNYECEGVISKREEQWDTVYEGVEFKMVKVDLGKVRNIFGKEVHIPNEVPYAMHQLKVLEEK